MQLIRLSYLLPAVMACQALAQPGRTTLVAPNLHTVQLVVDGDASQLPVIPLDGSKRMVVSFDDLTHEYRRYTYRIEHCDFEGNPTEGLFESEYLSAASDEEVIEDYEPSTNTTVLYTHYRFTLPNTRIRPLISGNYRLTVSTENDEGEAVPMLQTYFAVVDNRVPIRPTISTNTDIDWNAQHQQLSMRMDFSNEQLRDAESEVRTLVMQNRRLDNVVVNPPCTSQNGNVLIWEHDKDLIFKAGNEYRKMELLSTRYPGMHGDYIEWFDPYYHYTLFTDAPRRNYLYDEDRDGLFLVRSESAGDPNTEADYVVIHFALASLPIAGRTYYVNGNWATTGLSPRYRMNYNPQSEAYEAAILLKTGYYNYQYLCTDATSPHAGFTAPTEGDFYQTENEYNILAYFRPTGSRYWQLVGYTAPIFRKK